MTRVATVALQGLMASGIMRAQLSLNTTQTQLATGKKAPDFASLGTDGVRNMSAHSLKAQQTAYADTAKRLGTTLVLYDAHIGTISNAASTLRADLLAAVGTGQTAGLGASFRTAFDQVRASLNASIDGVPLFGGSQTNIEPMKPASFEAMAGQDVATAFANDDVKSVARIGDRVDMRYGITASEVGTGLLAAFRTLAEAGPIGATPTEAQKAAFTTALGQIGDGLDAVQTFHADNGRRQATAETMATRAVDRGALLDGIISSNEDADLGQIAIDLAQNKTILQASFSVFSQLAGLNLGLYLK
jgi:flagellar hook-associated protein 3 FlgL